MCTHTFTYNHRKVQRGVQKQKQVSSACKNPSLHKGHSFDHRFEGWLRNLFGKRNNDSRLKKSQEPWNLFGHETRKQEAKFWRTWKVILKNLDLPFKAFWSNQRPCINLGDLSRRQQSPLINIRCTWKVSTA